MSAKVKNQHYIPQMYLNLFSTNDNRLCVWNLSTGQVLDNQSSRNFASSITQNHSKIHEEVVEQKLIIFLHDLAYRTENPRKEIEMVKNATIHHSTQNNIAQAAKDSAKKTQLYYLLGLKPLLDTAHMLK